MINLTRRAALGALAATAATPVLAKAPMLGPLRPMVNRVKLGGFEVTIYSRWHMGARRPAPNVWRQRRRG